MSILFCFNWSNVITSRISNKSTDRLSGENKRSTEDKDGKFIFSEYSGEPLRRRENPKNLQCKLICGIDRENTGRQSIWHGVYDIKMFRNITPVQILYKSYYSFLFIISRMSMNSFWILIIDCRTLTFNTYNCRKVILVLPKHTLKLL